MKECCRQDKEKKKKKRTERRVLVEGGMKEEDGEKRLCSFGKVLTDCVVIIKPVDF
jgi:hypothetical protein